MYCMIEDSVGNRVSFQHPSATAQRATTASVWNIALSDIADAGVDITSVQYLYLGFGQRCNPNPGTPGGEGTVVFDNIYLHPPRCVGLDGYRQAGDLNGDCTVGPADVKVMTRYWLDTDRLTGPPMPVAGDDPNMLARWEFEDGFKNDPNGAAGSVANGKAVGSPEIVADPDPDPSSTRSGMVVYFDQSDPCEHVDCNSWGGEGGLGDFNGLSYTMMCWERQTQQAPTGDGWATMLGHGEAGQKLEFGFVPYLVRMVHFTGHAGTVSNAQLDNNVWHHVACTFEQFPDANGGMARIYINGRLDIENDVNEIAYTYSHNPTVDPNWTMGAQDYEGNPNADPPVEPAWDREYYGYLDDVRVYNRQLSEEEIMYIAGITTPNSYPLLGVPAQANLYDLEPAGQQIINMKDFSVLALDWLESDLWPPGF
jgi:hypothetical protein